MDLRGQEIKNTYGNVVTIGSSAGSPTTGELTNGQNSSFTSTYLGGNFGIGSSPTTYGSLNVLALGSSGSAAGGIIDIVGTSGRLASIYTEASGKLVLTADPTNGEAGTSMEFNVDGSNAMFIDSSQRVGVNTTTPVSAFTVVGTTTAGITVQSSSGASNGLKIFNDSTTDTASVVNHYSGPLVFGTANTERMRIDSAGNVGIGTGSPNRKLTVHNAASSVIADFKYTAGGFSSINLSNASGSVNIASVANDLLLSPSGTERMRITSAGNVGIGTSSPAAKLEVEQATGGEGLRIDGASGGFALVVEGGSSYKSILRNASIGTSYFGNTAPTDGLIVEGNVGIGTSSPSAKLHVYSGEAIIATNTDGLKLSYSAGNSSGIVDTAFSDNNLEFRTNGSTKMWIANAGNVGIGTTTPETKLDVDGDIQTAAPETSTNAAWKLGNVGLGGVEVGPIDYITVSVGGFVVKLPIAIFPETQAFYDRVIADGGTFEGLLGYESAVTILKAQ